MTVGELSLAILALLLSPGPTNTLMFVAGAERGFVRALPLLLPELCGYMVTVLPLALLGGQILERYPAARPALMAVAACWVAWLAMRLWLSAQQDRAPAEITASTVAITTVLNPKALVFGLVLLPSTGHLTRNLAMFAVLVTSVAALWILGGALLSRRNNAAKTGTGKAEAALPVVRRLAALWLAVVAAALAAKAAGAA